MCTTIMRSPGRRAVAFGAPRLSLLAVAFILAAPFAAEAQQAARSYTAGNVTSSRFGAPGSRPAGRPSALDFSPHARFLTGAPQGVSHVQKERGLTRAAGGR